MTLVVEHAMSVLIVEDNAFTRKLLRAMVRQIPVRDVLEAGNGSIALDVLRTRPVDIILLDWTMPTMGGKTFLAHLPDVRFWEKEGGRPAVLVITAHAKRSIVLEAAEAGADGVVAKPISPKLLKERLLGVYGHVRTPRAVEPETPHSADSVVMI
ncbi:MAG: response regulator [Pseudomonadota bacterium]